MSPIDAPNPIDISLGQGLAEGIDPKVLPFGAASKLVNYEVSLAGALTKRLGFYGVLAATEVGASAYPLGATSRLLTAGDSLLTISPDYTDSLPHLYSYSSGLDAWADLDTVPPCSVRRDPLVRLNQGTLGGLVTVFGTGASYLLVAYYSDAGGGFVIYYRVIDLATGAIVVRETVLTSTVSQIAMVSVNGNAWVLYNDSAGLKAKKLSGTDPTSTTTVTLDATATVFRVSAAYLNLGKFVACWSLLSSPLQLEMRTINASTGAVIDTAFYNTGGASIKALACTGDSSLGTAFAWIEGTPSDQVMADIRDVDLASIPGATPIEAGAAVLNEDTVGIELDRDGNAYVFYEAELTAGEPAAIARLFTYTGPLGDRHIAYRCNWASGPRRMGDSNRVFATLAVPQQGTLNANFGLEPGPAHFGLVCVDDTSAATPPLLLAHLTTTVARAGGLLARWWPIDSSEQVWVNAASTTTSDAQGYSDDTSGIDLITLDFSAQQAGAYHSVISSPLVLLGGGLVVSQDQHQAVENSFLQAPQIITGIGDPADAGLASAPSPGNSYLYRCRYEWVDDRGQIHVSPWSEDYELTLEDAGSLPYHVTLTILCTSVTRRGRSDKGASRDAQIAVYRSQANGASASGDVSFYRLLPYGSEDAQLNDRTSYSVDFVDTSSDAVVLAAAYGQVQFPIDVLAPICPPASADLLVHQGRVWLLSAEDRREVWPSRLLVPGEAPAFVSELVQRLPDSPTEGTGLAALDDKTIIFCEDRIYYLSGDGPDDTGQTGRFTGPYLVTAQQGCIDARSVVQTPEGVFFLSSSGISKLDRSLTVADVGEPVKTTVDAYGTCLASYHDPARSRASWLMATVDDDTIILIYDYLHGLWSLVSTDATNRLRAMTLWQGRTVVGFSNSFEGETTHYFRHEGAGAQPGWDLDPDDAATWVSGIFETPWICPGGPGAYQRVRNLFLLGQRLSDCRVKFEVFLDFDTDTVVQTKTVNLKASTTTIVGLPLLRYVLPLDLQACEAVKFRLTDLTPDTPSGTDTAERAGLALTRMSLELGPERDQPRLPAANRGGT